MLFIFILGPFKKEERKHQIDAGRPLCDATLVCGAYATRPRELIWLIWKRGSIVLHAVIHNGREKTTFEKEKWSSAARGRTARDDRPPRRVRGRSCSANSRWAWCCIWTSVSWRGPPMNESYQPSLSFHTAKDQHLFARVKIQSFPAGRGHGERHHLFGHRL
jgi:hypothetical protein